MLLKKGAEETCSDVSIDAVARPPIRVAARAHNLMREIVSDLLVIILIELSLRKMSVFGYKTTVGYETTDRHAC